MNETYIKTENELQQEILSKDITAKSWGELAEAVREKAKRLTNVADAFERYDKEGEPFIGEHDQKVLGQNSDCQTGLLGQSRWRSYSRMRLRDGAAMSFAVEIKKRIAEGDLRNAAGLAIYEVFGPQRLGKSKRALQCAELQDNFTLALENLREHLISKLREVSIYNGDFNDEREVEPIVVYMRCLEALGVDVDREAEHVRQIMRDAIEAKEEEIARERGRIANEKRARIDW